MTKPALAYTLAIIAAAAAFASAHVPATDANLLATADWVGAAAFIATGLLLQAIAIDFATGRQGASSIAFIPLFATAIVFPPVVSLIAVAVVIGFAELFLARSGILKSLFNVSQIAIALGVGSHLYHSIFDLYHAAAVEPPAVDLIGFVALVALFFGLNAILSSIAISLLRSQPFGPTFRAVVGNRGANVASGFLASPVVVVTVILYVDYYVFGIALTLLPLLLLRRSYQSQKKLAEANQDLLTALIKTIETRDPYTSGHSIRVRTLARLIAEDLGLSPKLREHITNAALLHDIGKVDPAFAAVLRKPHALTPEERELIQTHAAKGADMLRELSSVDREVVEAVRHHHERYDGKGYPDGISGTAIPLSARIIMLCDSIDAMLSDRPYRKALTVEQVKSELVRCSALQFDPTIVEVVLKARTLEKAVELVAEWSDRNEDPRLAVIA